jgi:amino acid transporter
VFVAFSAACTLLCLRWASSRFPGTGAFYTIFHGVFGRRAASGLVFLYFVSTIFGISTIAAGLGQYFLYLGFPHLLLMEISVIGLFLLLNIRGIYVSGMAENILTALKVTTLFTIAFLLLPRISPSNFLPFSPLAPVTIIHALLLIYWPFTGFEISAIPVDEVIDKSLIGRSLAIVMGIVIFLYLILNLSLIGTLGSAVLASSPAPLASAAELLFPMAGTFVALVGIVAMISALNAYLVGGSRVLQNLAEQCTLPWFRDLNRWGTPALALLLCSALSGGLLFVSNRFGDLATISVITTLIPYFFISAATFLLFPAWRFRIIAFLSMAMTAGILIFSILP